SACVPDAQLAGWHVCLELGDQRVDLGLGLGDARPGGLARAGQLEDGYAGGVIAAILQPLEAVHQDGGCLSVAQVADDPAHPFTSTRTPGRDISTGAWVERPRGGPGYTAGPPPELAAGRGVRVRRDAVDQLHRLDGAADPARVLDLDLEVRVRRPPAQVDRAQLDVLDLAQHGRVAADDHRVGRDRDRGDAIAR